MICLIQLSGPTLKLNIGGYPPLWGRTMAKVQVPESLVIKEIWRYSERIKQLRIEVDNATMPLSFKGFKRRLSNLRILCVHLTVNEVRDFDVFEIAPALRQVTIQGLNQYSSIRLPHPFRRTNTRPGSWASCASPFATLVDIP